MKRIRKAGKQGEGECSIRFGAAILHSLRLFLFSCFPAFLIPSSAPGAEPVIIGSKKFTESYVLAEIANRSLQSAGLQPEHR
ncbi:MAG: hypothetical protein M3372_01800, partial [Verrucomicrobiota bacterium]|nr:hypothetical protein [Verrucomicrobiota bacterium]